MAENSTLWTWGNQQKYHTEVKENIETKLIEHIDDDTIHLTAEKAIEAAATAISNPNLLDNPDFAINQKGQTEWNIGTTHTFIVDRWYSARTIISKTDDGLSIAWNGTDSTDGWIQQQFNSPLLIGKTVTTSISINGIIHTATAEVPTTVNSSINVYKKDDIDINYSNHGGTKSSIVIASHNTTPITINWVKMELGSVASQFIPPNPAEELLKIQAMDGTLNADMLDGYNATDFALAKDQMIKSYFDPVQIGCTFDTSLTDMWSALPSCSDIYIQTDSLSDASWNLPYGQSVVHMSKMSNVRPVNISIYPKSGSAQPMYMLVDTNGIPTGTWIKYSDGGNADTLDGLNADKFMQGLGVIQSGDIKDIALELANNGGMALISNNVTDMPVDGYNWFVYITGGGTSHRSIIAIPATTTLGVYYMVYINTSKTWSPWVKFADGGNADKIKTAKNDYATTGAMYPTFVDSNNASATAEAAKTDYNVRCNIRQGTTSEVGIAQLCLGSITPKGQADNSRGIVLIYGEDAYYVNLSASTSMTGNVDIRLPNVSGTLALNTAATTSASGLVNTTTQTFAGNKTFNGQVLPNGATAYGTPQARKLASGTAAATTTNCPSGGWYGQHS